MTNQLIFNLLRVMICLFLIGGLACKSSKVQTSSASIAKISDLAATIDNAMLKEMRNSHLPGAAIVVVKDGKTVYKKGYGLANTDTGQKVNPDLTIFRIGSISKALTLLTLTRLVDKGLIDREADVSQYFGGIKNPHEFKAPIKVDHLLTHTSGFDQIGIGRHIYDFDQPLEERKAQRSSLSDFLSNNNLRRITPAGEYYRYDTYGTSLAGLLIEKVTGLNYADAMQQELFGPAGMQNSSVEVEAEQLNNLAVGHGYNNGEYQVMPYEIYQTPPASSIDATPADMGRLLEALTGGGANGQGRLFSPEMIQAILNPQYRPHPEFVGMSHGLQESQRLGRGPEAHVIRTIGHGGDMLGVRSRMVIVPELQLGIFITTNRNNEAGGGPVSLRDLTVKVIQHYHPLKTNTPYPIPSPPKQMDLQEYAGQYYFGVFCHSCNAAENMLGAWQRPSPIEIRVKGNDLMLREDRYLARGEDVFVRSDGYEMIYFGRNEKGKITFFVFSDETNSFERIE